MCMLGSENEAGKVGVRKMQREESVKCKITIQERQSCKAFKMHGAHDVSSK